MPLASIPEHPWCSQSNDCSEGASWCSEAVDYSWSVPGCSTSCSEDSDIQHGAALPIPPRYSLIKGSVDKFQIIRSNLTKLTVTNIKQKFLADLFSLEYFSFLL